MKCSRIGCLAPAQVRAAVHVTNARRPVRVPLFACRACADGFVRAVADGHPSGESLLQALGFDHLQVEPYFAGAVEWEPLRMLNWSGWALPATRTNENAAPRAALLRSAPELRAPASVDRVISP